MSLPIFSNEAFVNWLEAQPPNKTYRYVDHNNCAIAQYLKAQGFTGIEIGSQDMEYRDASGRLYREYLPQGWNAAVSPTHSIRTGTGVFTSSFGDTARQARYVLGVR